MQDEMNNQNSADEKMRKILDLMKELGNDESAPYEMRLFAANGLSLGGLYYLNMMGLITPILQQLSLEIVAAAVAGPSIPDFPTENIYFEDEG